MPGEESMTQDPDLGEKGPNVAGYSKESITTQGSVFSENESNGGERVPEKPGPPSNDVERLSGFKLLVVLAAISIVYFLCMLDTTVLATAIPFITDEFHSLLDVGWYGSAYTLTTAILQPIAGKIYLRFRTKWVFATCVVIFEVGSIICATAQSSSTLIGGRVVAGLGGAGLINGCLIIVSYAVPPHRTPALMGILIGIGQIGLAAGPLIGGAFTQYVTWRWCFYINLIVGFPVAAVIAIITIPDHGKKTPLREAFKDGVKVFDLPGFVLFSGAITMFFLALQFGGNQYAWDSSVIIGLFCGAGVNFIIWLIWDWHAGDDAMVPYSMMRQRMVWVSCLCMALLSAPMYTLTIYLPIYFQGVLGHTAFQSGVDFLATILTQLVFAVAGGRVLQKIGYFTPFLVVGTVLNTVGLGLMSTLSASSSTGIWVGYQIIYGTGRGLNLSVPLIAVQNTLPKRLIPQAMSMITFYGNFAGAVTIILCQTIFQNSLSALIDQYAPSVNPETVIAAGSTRMREVVPPNEIGQVLIAYAKSIDRVWYFCCAIAALPLALAWLYRFGDIRKKTDDGLASQQN